MAQNTEKSQIESHTEYTHTRVQCLSCGDPVPVDDSVGRVCRSCRVSA